MKLKSSDITKVALFTALTAIGSFISIPVGVVPITMQSLFVLLSGFLLGPFLGALSQAVYLILGLVGLPIFSSMTGGIQSIFKPSFGFLLSFIIASFTAGFFTQKKKTLSSFIKASVISSILMYLIGLPYMAFILNSYLNQGLTIIYILKIGFFIFIPGDILKLILASVLGYRLKDKV
ncbi:MAG TPA: biotin transporter BioY [Soehngenia sp.]|nr:biotin transporter BioY [Soehngenia sp.]